MNEAPIQGRAKGMEGVEPSTDALLKQTGSNPNKIQAVIDLKGPDAVIAEGWELLNGYEHLVLAIAQVTGNKELEAAAEKVINEKGNY